MVLATTRRRKLRSTGEDGASAVEYALIVAGIAAVVVAIVFALGAVLNTSVNNSCDKIKTQFDGAASQCSP